MWLPAVACRAARSTFATTRSPAFSSPSHGSRTTSAWSSPDAHDVDDRDVAVAVLAGDGALVGDLAAALRVERRLDELHEARGRRPRSSRLDHRVVLGSS